MKKVFFRNILCCAVIAACLVVDFYYPHAFAADNEYDVTSSSYIAADLDTAEIILAKDAKERRFPASTTKLVTALLVRQLAQLDDIVTVSRQAPNASPVRIGIKSGEKYTVRDLLSAAVIRSANDACVALACHVAGSEKNFVRLMNKKAADLGANDTVFINSNGLPGPGQYTTAYDMLLIAYAVSQDSFLVELLSTKKKDIASLAGRTLTAVSRNKLLLKDAFDFFIGKTGYTRAAGYCMVGVAKDDGVRVVYAFLGSKRGFLWSDSEELLNFAISRKKKQQLKFAKNPK